MSDRLPVLDGLPWAVHHKSATLAGLQADMLSGSSVLSDAVDPEPLP